MQRRWRSLSDRKIARGIKSRDEAIAHTLLRELEQEFDQIVQHRLECLAWLLQHEVLDIKLAIPRRNRRSGIYHEKLGIFADADGHRVVFTGSANESSAALIDNFECIDVFWSWEPALQSRVSSKLKNFQNLWSNRTTNLEVLEFPEAARRSLLRLCPKHPPLHDSELALIRQHTSHEGGEDYDDAPPNPLAMRLVVRSAS